MTSEQQRDLIDRINRYAVEGVLSAIFGQEGNEAARQEHRQKAAELAASIRETVRAL